MLELGTFGSVRGVPGNGYLYRNPQSEAVLVPSLIAAEAAAELHVAASSLGPNRPRFLAVLSVPSPRLRRSEIAGGRA